MPHVIEGRQLPILVRLEGRETDLYPRAVVKNASRAVVATVPLLSEGGGTYANLSVPMVGVMMTADIDVFEDAGFTVPSRAYPDPASQVFTSGADLSGLATAADLSALAKTQYETKFSTVFNCATNKQEILAWAEKDGQRVAGVNCAIAVKDSLGGLVWGATLATPSPDGVFRFVNEIAATAGSNYYINIDIVVDGQTRSGRQVFVTVG